MYRIDTNSKRQKDSNGKFDATSRNYGIHVFICALNSLKISNIVKNDLGYTVIMDFFKGKKEKIKKDIDDALRHEDTALNDENEEPVTYVGMEDAKSIEHQDQLEHDQNKEPVTFGNESEKENF